MKALIDSLEDEGFSDFNKPSCGFFLLLNLRKIAGKYFMKL